MAKKETITFTNSIKRWKPDHRYQYDKMEDFTLGGFKSTEKSLTDKEQYRINLASLRGQLASGLGSPTIGSYSLKAGESYNSDFDFSYLNRPDISLVELHEYIENKRKELEKFNGDLKIKISDEIEQAEAKVKEIQQAELQKYEVNKSE